MTEKSVRRKVRLFIAGHCVPCHELKELVDAGALSDVEVIDIETEEGFSFIEKLGLTGVPSIYTEDGQKCEIKYEDDQIDIICPVSPEEG